MKLQLGSAINFIYSHKQAKILVLCGYTAQRYNAACITHDVIQCSAITLRVLRTMLYNDKIISTKAFIEIKTKHMGKFNYVVQLVSEKSSIMCSSCASCSILVNVIERHEYHKLV